MRRNDAFSHGKVLRDFDAYQASVYHYQTRRPSPFRPPYVFTLVCQLLVQKNSEVCLEFRAFEKLIPDKAAHTRGVFPRLALDSTNESETGVHSV